MIPKKTKKGNLESRRSTFGLIGLVFILSLVYLCFELFATQKNQNNLAYIGGDGTFVDETIIPLVDLTTPPPTTKVEQTVLKDFIIRVTDKDGEVDIDDLLKMLQFNGLIPEPVDKPEIPIIPEIPTEEPPLIHSEVMPKYPGGDKAMYAFLTKHLTYPERPANAGIQGISLIEFVVEKDGSVSNTSVRASLHPDCDNEAIRVIKMLKFSPGLVNNKPVRVYYVIPVLFSLN